MPNLKSAKKALRQSIKRKATNRTVKSRLKLAIKSATKESLSQVFSLVDKAAKNHLLHRNKAARVKSALAKKLGAPTKKRASAGLVAKKTKVKAAAKKSK